jgi:hypothetical protein
MTHPATTEQAWIVSIPQAPVILACDIRGAKAASALLIPVLI